VSHSIPSSGSLQKDVSVEYDDALQSQSSKSCDVDLHFSPGTCSTDLNIHVFNWPSRGVSSTQSETGEHASVSPYVSRVISCSSTHVETAEPDVSRVISCSSTNVETAEPEFQHAFVEPPLSRSVQSVDVDSLDVFTWCWLLASFYCPTDISPPVGSSTMPCTDLSSLPSVGVIPGENVSCQPADKFSEFNRRGVSDLDNSELHFEFEEDFLSDFGQDTMGPSHAESSTVPCAWQSSQPAVGVTPGENVSNQPADEFSEFNKRVSTSVLSQSNSKRAKKALNPFAYDSSLRKGIKVKAVSNTQIANSEVAKRYLQNRGDAISTNVSASSVVSVRDVSVRARVTNPRPPKSINIDTNGIL